MNTVPVRINSREDFDRVVKGTREAPPLQDHGNLEIVTIDHGTDSGRALIALGFTVEVPGRGAQRVQIVTTARLFLTAAAVVAVRYDEDGRVRE